MTMGLGQPQLNQQNQQDSVYRQNFKDEQDIEDQQENSEELVTYNVVHWIEVSNSMEYVWSKKKDDIEHTGVVLKFNGMSVLSLDYGGVISSAANKIAVGSLAVKASVSKSIPSFVSKAADRAASVSLSGKVTLSLFNSKAVKIVGSFVKLSLQSNEEKEKAIKLYKLIRQIDIGDYRLKDNNCRNYVIAVATFLRNRLKEFPSENWSKFESEMQTLLSRDKEKFKEFVANAQTMLQNMLKGISKMSQNISLKS